jgi:hypothetical protein
MSSIITEAALAIQLDATALDRVFEPSAIRVAGDAIYATLLACKLNDKHQAETNLRG